MNKLWLLAGLMLTMLSFNCEKNPLVPKDVVKTDTTHRKTDTTVIKYAVKTPGRFGISYFKNSLAKTSADTSTSDSVTFDVGAIRGSKNFYFLIQNTGNYIIDSVILETNDSTMSVSPQNLYRLFPKDSGYAVSPLITNTINHSTVLENGIGFKPSLSPGDDTKWFTVRGVTRDSSNSRIKLKMLVKLKFTAYLMDFDLYSNDGKYDPLKPYSTIVGWSTQYSGVVPFFYSRNRAHSDSINNLTGAKFVNTGNTILHAFFYTKSSTSSSTNLLLDSLIYTVLPGDTLNIKMLPVMEVKLVITAISSDNTVCNLYKWPIEKDGNVCVGVYFK